METIWKCAVACLGLLFLELCNGLPINLENSASDSHTQFLTGLIGILLTVSTAVFLAGCVCCQRRNGFKEFRDSPVVISSVSTLDNGLVNPVANGEFTIFSPLSPPHHNNNVFLANQQIVSQPHEEYTSEDNRLAVWFSPNEKDFPRTRLKYIRELGKGWFGSVVEGAAQGINENDPNNWTPVAVRILEAAASVRERAAFLHDALIYRESHPNILRLLGRSLESVPFLLLQELCPQGDLKGYLREQGRSSEQQILLWCYQLTSALKHLHANKLTHPDIAARNCLLSSDLQLKLGDYGLSVLKYPEDYYQGAPGVPVRWCAPESLIYTPTTIQPKQVTVEANIWSLGVTMWEICESGEQPYKNLSDDEVISQVLGPPKLRLERPTISAIYTDYMYRLMQLCWSTHESRPSIIQIDVMLTDLLEVCKNTNSTTQNPAVSVDDFDSRWELLKPNTIVKTDNQVMETDDDLDAASFIQDKQMSPSLNNLLDDGTSVHMESWLENVALNNDNDVKNTETKHLPSDIKFKEGLKVEFKLCPMSQRVARSAEVLNDRTSSESETEDENWKKKIERGAYSEKVRQKSRSVTDLMVLTHIDCSESDSETPLPSLDYKANFYKNVRCAPRQNLENVSLMFGSEGNLLSVQDTFQQELQKLREERKDSLLFVPENISHDISSAANRRILEELNSTSEIKPPNQVFNVFNVTVSPKYNLNHMPKFKQSLSCNNAKTEKNQNSSDFQENTSCVKEISGQIAELNDTSNDNEKDLILTENQRIELSEQNNSEGASFSNTAELISDVFCNEQNLEENQKSELNTSSDKNIVSEPMPVVENEEAVVCAQQMIKENQEGELSKPCAENAISEDIAFMDVAELVTVANKNENDIVLAGNQKHEINASFEAAELITPVSKNESDVACEKQILEKNQKNELNPSCIENISEDSSLINPGELIENESDGISRKLFVETYCTPDLIADLPTDKIVKSHNSLELFENIETKLLQPETECDKQNQHQVIFDQIIAATTEFLHSEIRHSNSVEYKRKIVSNNDATQIIESTQAAYSSNTFETTEVIVEKPGSDITSEICELKSDSDIADKPIKSSEIKSTIEEFLKAERLHSNDISKISFDLSANQESIQPSSLTHSMVFTSSPFVKKQLENSLRESGFTSLNLFNDDQEEAECPENNLTYSIETWDNFLEKTLESQEECFSSFNSEPQSILFIENGPDLNNCKDLNATYIIEEPADNIDEQEAKEKEKESETSVEISVVNEEDGKSWEAGGGWFLHPQSNEDVSGEMEVCESGSSTSYVGFSMDDEIMAAIRNELLQKLPHAQGSSNEKIVENEEWDSEERNEVFIRYNVYNTPLSPIPEESLSEPCSKQSTPRYQQSDADDSDWSGGRMSPLEDVAEDSGSPQRGRLNRHTPSQDSCCSNDTLFNLEELTCTLNEADKEKTTEEITTKQECVSDAVNECDIKQDSAVNITTAAACSSKESKDTQNFSYITDFLDKERNVCSESNPSEHLNYLSKPKAPPLPSPEDKPWKQLPVSLLNYNHIVSTNESFQTAVKNLKNSVLSDADCVSEKSDYVNLESKDLIDCDSNADYVNVAENKNVDYENVRNGFEEETDDIYSMVNADEDIGVLGDIRFTGPGDGQLMSTSFSESNELGEEQGWDSGSDTRSSSSGEFIWKEGEHEASVKALHASSCDAAAEEVRPMEDIQEESGESCSSDDEGDGPEFVPSAWDKYATPTKSALRSPEKTDRKRKSKCVWFKKQKYHCVYEYPREPESPTLHSYDLWTSAPPYNSLDWDLEGEPYTTTICDDDDTMRRYNDLYKLKNTASYSIDPTFDDFYVSSSSKPFDMITGLTSQFFPGQNIPDEWTDLTRQTSENATPDSGVEDENAFQPNKTVLPLKFLAAAAAKTHTESKTPDALGGLRHTRNKLRLDLPPSPSAFTSNKNFSIEAPADPIVQREVPTFTTFGKSRFLVQHVDTPEYEKENGKNVSFEALPYKPINNKVEVVTGEASLLDSADEDSGIESSTLERKKIDTVE